MYMCATVCVSYLREQCGGVEAQPSHGSRDLNSGLRSQNSSEELALCFYHVDPMH